MELALAYRLNKLHTNARRCCAGYRRSKGDFYKSAEFVEAVKVLAALGDEQRLAMVMLLRDYGELCACEVEAAFDLSHSTVAHHLNLLSEAGVVESRKQGKWSYYRLTDALPGKLQALARFVASKRSAKCCCC